MMDEKDKEFILKVAILLHQQMRLHGSGVFGQADVFEDEVKMFAARHSIDIDQTCCDMRSEASHRDRRNACDRLMYGRS